MTGQTGAGALMTVTHGSQYRREKCKSIQNEGPVQVPVYERQSYYKTGSTNLLRRNRGEQYYKGIRDQDRKQYYRTEIYQDHLGQTPVWLSPARLKTTIAK